MNDGNQILAWLADAQERRIDRELIVRPVAQLPKDHVVAPRLPDEGLHRRVADDAAAVEHRDRSDAGQRRLRGEKRRVPVAGRRLGAADVPPVDHELPQRRVARGEALADVLGEDVRQIRGARLGGRQHLPVPPPQIG
jgi:hypothetical protein